MRRLAAAPVLAQRWVEEAARGRPRRRSSRGGRPERAAGGLQDPARRHAEEAARLAAGGGRARGGWRRAPAEGPPTRESKRAQGEREKEGMRRERERTRRIGLELGAVICGAELYMAPSSQPNQCQVSELLMVSRRRDALPRRRGADPMVQIRK
jgi:hypothetical protein